MWTGGVVPSGRVSAMQAQSPEFKLQFYQKLTEKKKLKQKQ
jgi:hypothetical protein